MKKFLLSTALLNLASLSSYAGASFPAPTVKCSVVDWSGYNAGTSTDTSVIAFSPFVFVKGENGDQDDYETDLVVSGVSLKLEYDLNGSVTLFIKNGKKDIGITSMPAVPANSASRNLFYVPYDSNGQVLKIPLQFDVECSN